MSDREDIRGHDLGPMGAREMQPAILRIGVAIAAFDRPKHLSACLEHLEISFGASARLPVHIYQDAPQGAPSHGWKATNAVARHYPHGTLVLRERHVGMFNVTQSISDLLASYDAVISLEDDVCVSVDFIAFMVDCLRRYAECEDVFSVCGEQFDFPELAAQPEHILFARFFLRHGFGVWRRSWRLYDPACPGFERLAMDERLSREFNIFGGGFLSDLLIKVCRTDEPVYDLRWYFNMVSRDGFSAMSTRSLIFNRGYSGGTQLRSRLFSPLRGWARIAWRLGFGSLLYQRFYRGRARLAGSQAVRRGEPVLENDRTAGFVHSDYAARREQHRKYARLLQRRRKTS